MEDSRLAYTPARGTLQHPSDTACSFSKTNNRQSVSSFPADTNAFSRQIEVTEVTVLRGKKVQADLLLQHPVLRWCWEKGTKNQKEWVLRKAVHIEWDEACYQRLCVCMYLIFSQPGKSKGVVSDHLNWSVLKFNLCRVYVETYNKEPFLLHLFYKCRFDKNTMFC